MAALILGALLQVDNLIELAERVCVGLKVRRAFPWLEERVREEKGLREVLIDVAVW
jgi:hypothetical protein